MPWGTPGVPRYPGVPRGTPASNLMTHRSWCAFQTRSSHIVVSIVNVRVNVVGTQKLNVPFLVIVNVSAIVFVSVSVMF